MNKTLIAIDPGKHGGIAWQHPDKKACSVHMPETEGDLLALLKRICRGVESVDAHVVIENLVKHMGPGTPASTMAVYASNWGFIKGVVMATDCPLQLVSPQKWQKTLSLGITGKHKVDHIAFQGLPESLKEERKRVGNLNGKLKRDWKNKLKGEAQRLFPHLEVTLDTADALLILQYAKLTSV